MHIPDRSGRRFEALISGDLGYCFGKSTPDAPDYTEAARLDREALNDQTWANRPEQNTPFGQTQWEQSSTLDPSTGQPVNRWTQNTTLTPESQRALDAQLGLTADRSELGGSMMSRAEAEYGEKMDWSQLPGVTGGADARQAAEDSIYNRSTSRLDPQWQQAEEQKMAQLVAQGLRPGDKAYDQEMENMQRAKTDAYGRATDSAIIGGGQEASRQYGMESNERNRQLAETMQQRGFSLNEINALISGQQVGMPNMPTFNQAAAGNNFMEAASAQDSSDMNRFSAEQAGINSAMSGAGMAGGMMMSDRRLKRNIKRIGDVMGYPWYSFTYIWGEDSQGVMSDEINQDAVVVTPSGFDAVDYARIR